MRRVDIKFQVVLGTILSVCLLVGCTTSVPQSGDRKLDSFLENRRSAAREFEAQGHLNEAVRTWRIVQAGDPDDRETSSELSRLQVVISKQIRKYLKQAESGSGARERRLNYLRILALDGSNQSARKALMAMERDNALRGQNTKDAQRFASTRTREDLNNYVANVEQLQNGGKPSDLLALAETFLERYPGNAPAVAHRFSAYVRIGNEAREAGRLQDALGYYESANETPVQGQSVDDLIIELKSEISNALYKKGLRVLRTDLEVAIQSWQEALMYDSENELARNQLNQAMRIRANLRRIKNLNR